MFGIFVGEECTYKEIDSKGCQTDTVDCLHKYIVGENLSEYVVKQNPDSFKDEQKRSRAIEFVISHFWGIHQRTHSDTYKTAYNGKKHKIHILSSGMILLQAIRIKKARRILKIRLGYF